MLSDGKLCVGQDLQTGLGVLVCAGGGSVVLRHPRAGNVGDTRRAGGVCTLDGLCNSVRAGGGEAEADVATSTRSLGVWVVNGGKRRWMVVLWWVRLRCVVCCVVLCCVVLCCVVLCCVVLCCVVLCCVVSVEVGWGGWGCLVLMC